MTLYDLIKAISNDITPNTNNLYNYILYTCEDNLTFLRSSCLTFSEPLPNREIEEIEWVVIGFKEPVNNESDFILHNNRCPSNLLQVYFNNHLRTLEQAKEINKNLGFPYLFTLKFDKK